MFTILKNLMNDIFLLLFTLQLMFKYEKYFPHLLVQTLELCLSVCLSVHGLSLVLYFYGSESTCKSIKIFVVFFSKVVILFKFQKQFLGIEGIWKGIISIFPRYSLFFNIFSKDGPTNHTWSDILIPQRLFSYAYTS